MDPSLEAQRVRRAPPSEPETVPRRVPFCASSLEETKHTIWKVFIESLHLNVPEDELPYEQKLDEVVGLDSIAIIEFVAAVEKQFGVTLEPEFLRLEFVRDLPALAAHVDALRR
jgi:acyl carrier protein